MALSAGTLRGAWQADGTLRVTGETGPVLGAGSTTHLLLGASRAGRGGGPDRRRTAPSGSWSRPAIPG